MPTEKFSEAMTNEPMTNSEWTGLSCNGPTMPPTIVPSAMRLPLARHFIGAASGGKGCDGNGFGLRMTSKERCGFFRSTISP
jgi:hypothetical protein